MRADLQDAVRRASRYDIAIPIAFTAPPHLIAAATQMRQAFVAQRKCIG
ncbi:hypothetical protein L3067_01035 [Xanthomonas sp. PPL568]|nr:MULTISPECIES: hypothetical protein [Xanthomonas]MBB6367875.1 hypothetical protein [Xanthomonas sp. F10]MCI2243193.1 hypothetical protein [Xanthomonas indica]